MSSDIYALARIPIKYRCDGYYIRWYYNGWHYWYFYPGKIEYNTKGESYRTIATRKLSMGTGQITHEQCSAIKTIMNTRELYILTDFGWWNCIRIEPGSLVIYDHAINGYEIELTAIVGGRAISITGYSPVIFPPVRLPDPYCEVPVSISGQIWMCKNWDAAYPASRVYDDDDDNRIIWGGLYTWDQIMSPGFVPDGWHIPTTAEWLSLINSIGGALTAGGELKEAGITHWDSPNTGAVDTYGISILGSGFYSTLTGYAGIYTVVNLWTASESGSSNAFMVQFKNDSAAVSFIPLPKSYYFPVRLIKDGGYYPLLDRDGNEYTTINIGNQQWIVENYRTTKWANGVSIPYGLSLYTFLPTDYESHTFPTFTHTGLNISSAIEAGTNKRAAVIQTVKPGIYGMQIGCQVRITITNYVLNSGSNPFLFFSSDGEPGYYEQTTELTGDGIYYFTAVNLGPEQDVGIINYDPLGANVGYATDFQCDVLVEVQQWPDDISYTEAYGYPNHDAANVPGMGLLYNFKVLESANGFAYLTRGGVQEAGWRIPTMADWEELCVAVGGVKPPGALYYTIAGGKLKDVGTTYWNAPNTDADDAFDFKARGSGYIDMGGTATNFKIEQIIWSSDIIDPVDTGAVNVAYNSGNIGVSSFLIYWGFNIRLVRDI